MILWVEIKITYLVSQSTMTKIVSNLEDNKSFSMKSIEMEFYEIHKTCDIVAWITYK